MIARVLIALTGLCLLQTTAAGTPAGQQICLAPPSAEIPNIETAQAVAAVRDTFAGYLSGPSLSVTPLQARIGSQVREEARQKGCRFVLFVNVIQQSKVNNGLFSRLAAGAVQQGASQAAYESRSSAARVAASAAAGGAGSAQFATTPRVKDTLQLDSRLESGDGATIATRSQKRKATSPGEDLLTPLVAIAAEEIAGAVVK